MLHGPHIIIMQIKTVGSAVVWLSTIIEYFGYNQAKLYLLSIKLPFWKRPHPYLTRFMCIAKASNNYLNK